MMEKLEIRDSRPYGFLDTSAVLRSIYRAVDLIIRSNKKRRWHKPPPIGTKQTA